MWERRAFLKAAGAGFAASLLPSRAFALAESELVLASNVQKQGGGYAAALVSDRGALIASVDLPDRGHDICFSPVTGQAVAFARQPGTFAVVFQPDGSTAPKVLTSVPGRHFFGHGAFSPDGKLLYATENDFDNARGVIGVFDVASDFSRIGEFDTHGIGPHEMLLMADGETFVVANGGIETHPDYGRAELNLDSMSPSIVFISRRDGALIGQLKLSDGLNQLSIRHMALDHRGRAWFGCQYKGAAADQPQLVGYATRDGEIRLIDMPAGPLGDLRNYVGSVAATRDGDVIGISSPEGNTILAIDPDRAEIIDQITLENGCGVAAGQGGFVVSSGQGVMEGFAGDATAETAFDFGFDNHLRLYRG